MTFNFWSSWVLGLQEYSTVTFYVTLVVKPRASSLGGLICINWNEGILSMYWIVILLLYVYHFPPPAVLLSILLTLSFTYVDFKCRWSPLFPCFFFSVLVYTFVSGSGNHSKTQLWSFLYVFLFFWSLTILNFKLRFLIHFKFSCTWYEAIGPFVYKYPII